MLRSKHNTRAVLRKFQFHHSESGLAGLSLQTQRRDIGSTLASGLEQQTGDGANEIPRADQRTLPDNDGVWRDRNIPLPAVGAWQWPGPDGSEIPWLPMRSRHLSFDPPTPSPIPGRLTTSFLQMLSMVSMPERIEWGIPLLGSVGSLVAPVAGGILGAIAGSAPVVDRIATGVAEKAVLAEVSLQAILRLFEPGTTPPDDPIIDVILVGMAKQYSDNPINLAGFASTLSPWLVNYGLDIVEFKFAQQLESPRRRTIRDPIVLGPERKPLNGLPDGQKNVNKPQAFVEGLLEATLPVVHADKGAFDFLGRLIVKASDATITLQPLSSDLAWDALMNFRWNLLDILAAGSAVYIGHLTPVTRLASVIQFQRALFADYALSTLMKLPRDKLNQLKVKRSTSGRIREEGIFDFIKSTLQTMGPYPLEVTQRAVEQLTPFIHKKNSRSKTSTHVN